MHLTSSNFDEVVLQSAQLVLVDFWASWCGPCRLMMPVLEEISHEYEGRVLIAKINVDEQQDLAQQHNILSIPTFLLFKQGKKVDQFSGAMSKEQLASRLAPHLGT